MTLQSSIKRKQAIIKEFLEQYRDFPCLWSQKHKFYNNREVRESALQVLLEKYKLLQEDANLDTVRKKIDNIRCCYKRERNKVLASLSLPGCEEYRPTLWYYDLMRFLDKVYFEGTEEKISSPKNQENSREESEVELSLFQDDYESNSEEEGFLNPKRIKLEAIEIYDTDTAEETRNKIPHEEEESQVTQSQKDETSAQKENESVAPVHEAEAFGRTIGLQLKDLAPMQRFIAEKLISEVIFYGRLDKLSTQTNISFDRKN